MTVSSTTPRAGPYTGNDSATSFGFSFKAFALGDVQVVLTVNGVDTILVTGYSVSLNGDQEANPGGSVNYPLSGSPISAATKLTILRAMALTQPADLPDGGNFRPAVIEGALDRGAMIAQQLNERIARTLALQPSTEGVSSYFPAPEAGSLLGWNGAGTAIVNVPVSTPSEIYPPESLGFMIQSTAMRGNLLSHISQSRWASILDYSTTYDASSEIEEWIEDISLRGILGVVPDGKFIATTLPIMSAENVRIRGSSRPRLSGSRNALEGGSIFIGTLRFNGERVELENVGIDHGFTNTATAGDGLVLSASETGVYARLQNVIGLGRSADDAFHAILVEGYDTVDIDNIFGCRTWYGNALKLKKANVSRVRGYENAIAGCILRSNAGDGICEDINVSDVITVGRGRSASGSGGSDYGFYVVVDNQAARINIANVSARSAKQAIGFRVNANLTELSTVNMTASACESGVTIFTGPGDLYSAQMTNTTAVDCTAWALRVEKAVSLQVNGFFGMADAGSGYLDELIRVEAPTGFTQMDNIKLTSNYSNTTLGSIRYLNATPSNTIGQNLVCRIQGSGLPQPGMQTSTQTGLGITLSPVYTPCGRIHIASARASSAGTVTTIDRVYSPGATRFAVGTLLTVKNNDTQALTISSTATNVITKGGADTVIAASGSALFVFDGAFWVGV